MTATRPALKLRAKDLRHEVAQALLHLHDIMWLMDSPLVDLGEVRRRSQASRSLFADGEALRDVLSETVETLVDRLPDAGKAGLLRVTLQGIARHQSIAQIAREQGKSREHFSRTYWKLAANLVADHIMALNGTANARYTSSAVARKPSP